MAHLFALFFVLVVDEVSAGHWPLNGFPGKIFNHNCPDVQNLSGQSTSSCQAACDAHAYCNAVNFNPASGACALRACPCAEELVPTESLDGFTAYRRTDDCPQGHWPSNGFPGKIFNGGCPDVQNLNGQNTTSCQAACDAHALCNAVNFNQATGECALHACPCGEELVPTESLEGFTGYRRADDCPPSFANIFGSSMVLQRAPLQARLFGHATPRSNLTIDLATDGKSVFSTSLQADQDGSWSCTLPATPSSEKVYGITVALASGAQQQVLQDVVFGDVFVCSGQSNMQEPVSVVNNASAELAASSDFPWIRLAVVAGGSSNVPLRDTKGPLAVPWQRASPAALGGNNGHNWGYFSATCWLTARNVAEALGPSVPLGLLGTYVGGTPIESWTPGLDPATKDPQGHKSAVLYNAMVAPLTGLVVRCFLWYQGENNSFKPSRWIKYASDFPTMIRLWRQAWVNGTGQAALANTPFGFVQIGPRDCQPDADHQGNTPSQSTFYGGVRWSQTAFMYTVPNAKMPDTFMAVAADLAEGYSPVLPLHSGCVHYGNKQDVGQRLALGVRKAVYGQSIAAMGPVVTSVKLIDGTVESETNDAVVLSFSDEAGGALEVRNTSGFELSSNGRDYFAAPIASHSDSSVTLMIPSELFLSGHGGDDAVPVVASMRYILHDTPCINKTCAIYSGSSGLPSPPLVANFPGHDGTDPVGWNMSAAAEIWSI